MNTDSDSAPNLRGGIPAKLILNEETRQILGFAFEVLNEIGHGLHEKIYENALTVAFRLSGILFEQQRRFPVLFRGQSVGEFIPDLTVFGAVIVDPKVIDRITDHERGKMLNYLKITKFRAGPDIELQARPPGMGKDRPMSLFSSVSIRVHPWLMFYV